MSNGFDGIAVCAQDLKTWHPSFRLQAFIYRCAGRSVSGGASKFLSVLRSIVVDVVEAQSIKVVKAANGAGHRAIRVMLNGFRLQLVAIARLQKIVSTSVLLNPIFVPFGPLAFVPRFGVPAFLIFPVLLFARHKGSRVVWIS